MMLVWGVLPVWADISVATLHSARKNSFLLGCALLRFFGVYTGLLYVINLYLFPINLLSVGVTSSDISSMFNAAKRPLQVLTKLIDRQDITITAGEGRD